MTTKIFTVEVEVTEHPDHTEARAKIETTEVPLGGVGQARRNPADPDRPRIGDELAMARALSDLAHHLLDDAATTLELAEGHPAHLRL